MSGPEPTSERIDRTLTDRLRELEAAVVRRASGETAFVQQFAAGGDHHEETLAARLREVGEQQSQREAGVRLRWDERRRETETAFETRRAALKRDHDASASRVRQQARQETDRVNRQHEDSRWVASSVLDATAEESPERQYERIRASLEKTSAQQQAECAALIDKVHQIAAERGWSVESSPSPPVAAADIETLSAEFMEEVGRAREQLALFHRLTLPQLFVGRRPLWAAGGLIILLGVLVFLFVPPSLAGVAVGRTDAVWLAISAGTGIVLGLTALSVLSFVSSMQRSTAFERLCDHVSAARFFHEQWTERAEQEKQRRKREFESQREQRQQQLAAQLERYDAAHRQSLADIEAHRQAALQALDDEFSMRNRELDEEFERQLAALEMEHQSQLDELTQTFERRRIAQQAELDQYRAERERLRRTNWDQLVADWFGAVRDFESFAEQAGRDSRRDDPAWTDFARPAWEPPRAIPRGIRIGEFEVDLTRFDGGRPALPELIPPKSSFRVPALLPFPESPSLLLETQGHEGRREAIQAMQAVLLRMLTRIPPGKLRLTVLDPLGLGESFSGLMHLADYDELLITSRIWTEAGHIETRLAELTEHMENVLQKYLRNEFATIEQYNQFAGEVAEPYRVLVVADFPTRFSEQAARRLMSIAASGARCGVYLLMSADRTAPMPNAFDLAAIEQTAKTFVWDPADRRLRTSLWDRAETGDFWDPATPAAAVPNSTDSEERVSGKAFFSKSADLARWPLIVDAPPAPDVFTRIVRNVGEASKDVRRVEVSFSRIAPAPEQVWTKDSRAGIDIPLGRAGATRLQHLRLGKGTSQHVLVAGKTGSGKSTFFHTLITNVAMHYSPQEIELYLIDFKKGVEFKAYAPRDPRNSAGPGVEQSALAVDALVRGRCEPADESGRTTSGGARQATVDSGLPHARVIAIESDREFGVSVLQRLDGILNERGELFRRAGVQEIAAYRDRAESGGMSVESPGLREAGRSRNSNGTPSLPRILLIIDEFQEFFVEDDRYSQQAALLLDRLVRQGRAFGVHVILGSQTLGGAYSLARSTLGQVAVRIALQCSEADAHLILSEENTAARLLTRPGEAIYNDANGLIEGNHPFQIAWLPDDERAGYLAVIRHFQQELGIVTPPPIVFEGNVPSVPARNQELMTLVSSAGGGWPRRNQPDMPVGAARPAPRIWLGESVDIGPPTCIEFSPQAGANLLIVGSDIGAATGILTTSLIALAAQAQADDVADEPDRPQFFIFEGSAPGSPEAALWKQLAEIIPGQIQLVTAPSAPQAVMRLTTERHRRDTALDEVHPPWFVLIAGISRFRDLRKSDDEFSLSGFGTSGERETPDTGRQFADLVANGPALGLHTLLWADSYGAVDRWLSRQSLREFDLRVVLPMNATDSSNLIDSPAASRLGVHRALLYREETGTAVKFRPYGPPSPDWLDQVRRALAKRRPLEVVTDLEGFRVT